MIKELRAARDRYGSVFVTYFDDRCIPWRLLSLEEYLQYNRTQSRGLIGLPQLEEEIFKKCVLDQEIINELPYLNAGIISTVVNCIWQYSGPIVDNNIDPDTLNRDLQLARSILSSGPERAIHELVRTISLAFPSYKPEEIYAMDYETFVFRAVQAEDKLLMGGIIKQPLSFTKLEDTTKPKKPKFKKLNEEQKVEQGNKIKELWQQTHGQVKQKEQQVHTNKSGKWWNISPVLESGEKQTINFSQEKSIMETELLDNHEKLEPKEMREHILKQKTGGLRNKLIADAQWIYKDLIDAMKKKSSDV